MDLEIASLDLNIDSAMGPEAIEPLVSRALGLLAARLSRLDLGTPVRQREEAPAPATPIADGDAFAAERISDAWFETILFRIERT